MSKKYNIRWRESDQKELERVIKNFNAKLYRIAKNNPEIMDYQPEKVSKKAILETITTRADYNRTIRNLKNFTKRGAETPVKSSKGAKATQWAVDKYKQEQRAENIRRAKRRKELEEKDVKIRGKSTGVKRAQMGDIKENEVKPHRAKFDKMSQKEWEKAFQMMDKRMRDNYDEERKLLLLRNYMKGLMKEGFSDTLINLLNRVNLNKFVDTIDTDETATVDFIYDPLELKVKEDMLIDLWSEKTGNKSNGIDISDLQKEIEQEEQLPI